VREETPATGAPFRSNVGNPLMTAASIRTESKSIWLVLIVPLGILIEEINWTLFTSLT
jgi:hypothetical protein